ncbi:4Fe-4S dicluster domain-containing protein [bacterium BFN5]|nr:4Fe-4S dicluster domain-containing protein [bacterium BFN5]
MFGSALHGHKLEPRIVVKHSEQGPITVQCRHCEDAPCVHICPVNALYYQAGTVQLSEEACIGCRLCTQACPFSAIQVRVKSRLEGEKTVNKAKAFKCDLCFSRTGAVSEEACACVQSCPVKAMKLITAAE